MKLLLFLVGFALANAATTITRNNDTDKSITIHRNAPETYPSEFELGKTHRYNYTGDVRTSFPQTGNETIGQRIQCIVEIVPLTYNIWNMRLVEPTLYELNGTHDRHLTMINSTKITEELRTLLQYNVTFQMVQGQIKLVYANATEPEWILNIRKGILNMISVKMEKEDVYETDEEGVSGTCKTLYTIQETKNQDLVKIMNVTRVRDLSNCSKTPFNKLQTFKFQHCDTCTKNKKSMDATATFKYNITGTKQRFIINGVQSDARYVFFPLGVKGGSVFVQVNQTLHLINVTQDPLFTKSPEQVPRGTLLYTFPQLVKLEETMLNTIHKVDFFLKKLDEQSTKPFTVDTPSYFILLVKTLEEADTTTLDDIWNLIKTKPQQRKWFIEALPYVNQEEVTLLIKDLITVEETYLATDEKLTLLSRLGTIRQPTEKSVMILKEICEHKFLQWPHNKKVNTTYLYNITRMRHCCWRSFGIQVNALKKLQKFVSPTLIQTLTKCEETFHKSTKLTPWDPTVYKSTAKENQVTKEVDNYLTMKEAKALLNTTIHTKVREMCLIAIGQAGLEEHISYIQPILHQTYTNQTLDVRIAAATALRRMKTNPNKVLSLALPVYRNPYEDPELRSTLYLVMSATNQRPSVFTMIGQELNFEKSKQVRSFVYSHLKMMAEDVEPCNKKMAIAARYALVFTKPFHMGPTYSKVRTVRTFNPETEVGTKMVTQTMFSEGELTPSRTNVMMEVDMFGKKTSLIDVEVRTSGMTNLLEKMFGHDGHFYKRRSIFDLLKASKRKRRSVSDNEEELNNINRKLNPYEVTPEDPRLRLYINMLGNRITDLDINKEYLTTLIKEGKILTDFSNLEEELAKQQTFNMTKAMMLMDYKWEHPTIIGLPLSYNATVGGIMRVKINTTVKATPNLMASETLKASFNITPEVVMNAVFKMGVHTPLIKFGSAFNSTVNVTLPVHTNVSIDFSKKKYEILFPQIEKNLTFLNFTNKLYTFWQTDDEMENQTVVNTTLTNKKPVKIVMCMEPLNDTKLCMNASFVPRLGQPDSPFHPLTGPSYVSIYQNKTLMAPKMTKFLYHVKEPEMWETKKKIDITMTTTGVKPQLYWPHALTDYENITTWKIRINQPEKKLTVTTTQSSKPNWLSVIAANITEGDINVEALWGMPREYTQKINNTEVTFPREFFLQLHTHNWTWNDTRNVTFYWAELPHWLKNVTYMTKTVILPVLMETMKQTVETDYTIEPVQNHLTNSTTISLKIKTNSTMDIRVHLPIQTMTIYNVTVPFNTSVLKKNVPHAIETIQNHVTEKYLSGNCTYNHTGHFLTYDRLPFNYNLTGSCPHVLTKDCSPDKRFTVLVQNARVDNPRIYDAKLINRDEYPKVVTTTPIVTVYIDNHKVEMLTENDEVKTKFNGMEQSFTSQPVEITIGTMVRNQTHITLKAKIGLTVVYSKYNVTTYLSPWYVNKTCGLCGDFNGETFRDMKTTLGEEVTNSTKFGTNWLVQGDDCKDESCKLVKEELYVLPKTVFLANKPALCFSKEPVKVCPIGCSKMTVENVFYNQIVLNKEPPRVPTQNFVKVPFFCMATGNAEETKALMKSRTELIKSQPIDLFEDVEVPHDCNCSEKCNTKV